MGRPWQFAKGRKRDAGLNSYENEYAAMLDARVARGEILWRSEHEAIRLRLADRTFVTLDYFVMAADGILEAHDVKGDWIDPAQLVRIKMVAELYPLRVILARRSAIDCEPYRDPSTGRIRRKRHEWTHQEV